MQIYARAPVERGTNYDWLKQQFYDKFNLGVETHRRRFYRATRRHAENFKDFGYRITKLFDRWIEGCELAKNYEPLRQLILTAAYLDALPPHLAIMLRDDAPENITEAIKLAAAYDENRNFSFSQSNQYRPESDHPACRAPVRKPYSQYSRALSNSPIRKYSNVVGSNKNVQTQKVHPPPTKSWYPTANPSLNRSLTPSYRPVPPQQSQPWRQPYRPVDHRSQFASVRGQSTSERFNGPQPAQNRFAKPAGTPRLVRPTQTSYTSVPIRGKNFYANLATSDARNGIYSPHLSSRPDAVRDKPALEVTPDVVPERGETLKTFWTDLHKRQIDSEYGPYVLPILVNGPHTYGVRDSGSTITIVDSSLIKHIPVGAEYASITTAFGASSRLPLVEVNITSSLYTGVLRVAVSPTLQMPVLLRNDIESNSGQPQRIAQALTRSGVDTSEVIRDESREAELPAAKPLVLPTITEESEFQIAIDPLSCPSPAQFLIEQREDPTLKRAWRSAQKEKRTTYKSPVDRHSLFFVKDQVLY